MVVTRRTPTAPGTRPTQPAGKGSKNKAHATDVVVASDSNASSNDTQEVSKGGKSGKGKSKQKKHKKNKKRQTTFIQLLSQALLLFFTIYTLRTCPTDESLSSPICRGLFEYRRLVLEPLIIPTVKAAAHHPAIHPYIEYAKPHYERTLAVAVPILQRGEYEWNNRVIPQWNQRVVPQWNKRVIPLWNQHAAPHVAKAEALVEPYLSRATTEYTTRVAPHLSTVRRTATHLAIQAHPYVILAAQKTHQGYVVAKPYAIPLWEKVKEYLGRLLEVLKTQRRLFVDPHVARIWEKVKELSSGTTSSPKDTRFYTQAETKATSEEATPSSALESVAPAIPTTEEAAASITSVLAETLHPSPEEVVEPTATPTSSSSSTLAAVASQETVVEVASASVVSPNTIDSTSPTAFVGEEPPIPPVLEDALESPSSSIIEASASSTPIIDSTQVPTPPNSDDTPIASNSVDLEDFYASLGLDKDLQESIAADKASTDALPVKEETEEEREARVAKVAEKRAKLLGRHVKWELQIEEDIALKTRSLMANITALREAAVDQLHNDPEIKSRLDELEKDGEQYLKGIEAYYQSLLATAKGGDKNLDKSHMWDKLTGKVDEKFHENVRDFQGFVHQWYVDAVNKEIQEVADVAEAVKALAQKAQGDIGLDYAWLEDVTYNDWQRYHDLIRRSERFTEVAEGIQNGTHSLAPPAIVVEALNELDAETTEVVAAFEMRLKRLKKNGEKSFAKKSAPASSSVNTASTSSSAEPQVSILPIEPEDPRNVQENGVPEGVLLGKNAEQVAEGIAKAERAKVTADDIERTTEATASAKEHIEL